MADKYKKWEHALAHAWENPPAPFNSEYNSEKAKESRDKQERYSKELRSYAESIPDSISDVEYDAMVEAKRDELYFKHDLVEWLRPSVFIRCDSFVKFDGYVPSSKDDINQLRGFSSDFVSPKRVRQFLGFLKDGEDIENNDRVSVLDNAIIITNEPGGKTGIVLFSSSDSFLQQLSAVKEKIEVHFSKGNKDDAPIFKEAEKLPEETPGISPKAF